MYVCACVYVHVYVYMYVCIICTHQYAPTTEHPPLPATHTQPCGHCFCKDCSEGILKSGKCPDSACESPVVGTDKIFV